jgi:hypothetical protein
MKNSHKISLDVLNFKILFISMINVNMLFKNDMFNVYLNGSLKFKVDVHSYKISMK